MKIERSYRTLGMPAVSRSVIPAILRPGFVRMMAAASLFAQRSAPGFPPEDCGNDDIAGATVTHPIFEAGRNSNTGNV